MSVRLLGVVATALLAVSTQAATAQDAGANDSAAVPNGLVLQNSVPDAQWTASADALTLTRHKPDYRALVGDFPTGAVLASASDLHFNTAPGYDIDVTLHHAARTAWDLEGVFSNVDSSSAGVGPVPVGTGTPLLLFANAIAPSGTSISVADRTLLRSAEFNARRDVGEFFSVLAGFRYLEFDDNLAVNTFGGAATAQATVTANNFLAGGQIGGDAHFAIGDRWQFSGVVKAGAYCDRASNSSNVVVAGVPFASAAATTNGAFVGQIEATAAYQINHAWSIRGGYQWMWLDGVAVAGNQMAVSNPAFNTATVDHAATPYFHGAFLGIEFWH